MDSAQFTPDNLKASANAILDALPQQMQGPKQQMQAQLDQKMAKFSESYNVMKQAGGEGMLLLVQGPAKQGPDPAPIGLVRVKAGTSPEAMAQAIAQVQPDKPEFVSYGDQWLVEKKDADRLPDDGTAEQAETFQKLLSNTEPAAIRMAFRMTDAVRQEMAKGQQQQQMGGGNPASALVGPSQKIEAGWTSVQLGAKPVVTTTMQFANADDAKAFQTAWQQMLNQGRGFVQMMANNPNNPNPLDPQVIQDLFASLEFEQKDATLTNQLDSKFIGSAAQLAPMAQGMFMMMMMQGHGGPGGPMGPRPAQPMPPRH